MLKHIRGFTLIELMIVITIIGILASLAVSAYQTFTVRTQIAEGLTFASGIKVPIVDAYTNGGVAPANRQAAGLTPLPTDTRGSYVSSVEIGTTLIGRRTTYMQRWRMFRRRPS